MSNMWTSPETFENDLFAFSEIEGIKDNKVTTTPQSLLEWEARNGINQHQSIFDTPDLSADVTYIFSGRGRGGRSTIIRPGAPPSISKNMDMDIMRKIREVSGLGFSNALIEQSFRPGNGARDANNTITGAVSSEIKFQPVASSKRNKSNGSTPSNTSRVQTPTNISEGHSPLRANSHKSPSVNSRSSSRVSTSSEQESNVVVENTKANPLPLSAILKKAKDVRKKALEKPVVTRKDENKPIDKKKTETKENVQVNNVDQNDLWWSNDVGSEGNSNSWRSSVPAPNTNINGGEGYNNNSSWRRGDPTINRFFNNSSASKKFSQQFNIRSSAEFPELK